MTKYAAIDRHLLDNVTAAIESCCHAGSPVTGHAPEYWQKLAHVAIRRIRSFDRRNVSPGDDASQVRDIARGFVEHFEADPKLVGPLITDYEFVARKSLDAYRLHISKSA